MSRTTVLVLVFGMLAALAVFARGPNLQQPTTKGGNTEQQKPSAATTATSTPSSIPQQQRPAVGGGSTKSTRREKQQQQQQQQQNYRARVNQQYQEDKNQRHFDYSSADTPSSVFVPEEFPSLPVLSTSARGGVTKKTAWRPRECGSVFSESSDEAFRVVRSMLEEAGWNFTQLQVTATAGGGDETTMTSAKRKRYCASWKSGVFDTWVQPPSAATRRTTDDDDNATTTADSSGGVRGRAKTQLTPPESPPPAAAPSSRLSRRQQKMMGRKARTGDDFDEGDGSGLIGKIRWNKPMPMIFASGGGTRLPPLKCSVGACFASLIAERVDAMNTLMNSRSSSSSSNKNKEEAATSTSSDAGENNNKKKELPRWIMFIGDSRMRHLLARLMMMIRSEHVQNTEAGDNTEMNRPGVIEHYFHLNATYTVWGRRRQRARNNEEGEEAMEEEGEGDDDFEIVSDRLHVLPEHSGCADDDIAMFDYNSKNTRGGKGKPSTSNNNKNKNEIEMLFRICLWWNTESMSLLHQGPFMMNKLKPITVMWMPTLHECMGRNRRGKQKHTYTKCSVDSKIVRLVAAESVRLVEKAGGGGGGTGGTRIRNFLMLTTPNSQKAPKHVVSQRNRAATVGFEQGARYLKGGAFRSSGLSMLDKIALRKLKRGSSSSSPPGGGGGDDNNDDNYQHQQKSDPNAPDVGLIATALDAKAKDTDDATQDDTQQQQQKRQRQQKIIKINPALVNSSKSLELWLLDQAQWWYVSQPKMCDFTHSMCNLKPHRPEEATRMDFFCDKCHDQIGFVAIKEMIRILLS